MEDGVAEGVDPVGGGEHAQGVCRAARSGRKRPCSSAEVGRAGIQGGWQAMGLTRSVGKEAGMWDGVMPQGHRWRLHGAPQLEG